MKRWISEQKQFELSYSFQKSLPVREPVEDLCTGLSLQLQFLMVSAVNSILSILGDLDFSLLDFFFSPLKAAEWEGCVIHVSWLQLHSGFFSSQKHQTDLTNPHFSSSPNTPQHFIHLHFVFPWTKQWLMFSITIC